MLLINYTQQISNDRNAQVLFDQRFNVRVPTANLEVSHFGLGTSPYHLTTATTATRTGLIKGLPAKYNIVFDVGGTGGAYDQNMHVLGYIENDAIPDFEGYRHWKEVYVSDGFGVSNGSNGIKVTLLPIAGRSDYPYTKYALIDGTTRYGSGPVERTFAAKIQAPIEPEIYVIRGAVTSMDDLTNPAKLVNPTDEVIITRDGFVYLTVVTNFFMSEATYDYASRNNDLLPNINLGIAGLTTSPLTEKYYIYPITFNIIGDNPTQPGNVNTVDYLLANARIKLRTLY